MGMYINNHDDDVMFIIIVYIPSMIFIILCVGMRARVVLVIFIGSC